MANGVLRWLCVVPGRARRRRREARLVLWGGETRAVEPGSTAWEVMVEHGAGGRVVCRADGFRIGRPAPVLAVEDQLEAGRTYIVVPVDRLPAQGQGAVTAASLAALSCDSHNGRGGVLPSAPSLAGGGRSPFEYVKDGDGRTVISVTEEFIVKAFTGRRPPAGAGGGRGDEEENGSPICSTPELRKHYELLVGAARGRPWSPRLETIEERKARRGLDVVISPRRLSPARLLGLVKGSSELAR
ncbi:uncharacterized protein LOC123425427 [Hordeum vulgare subsp. vulgare]|uniref:Uncharacterized protein n=1 Tax=Hordeum vulgare subsp. vulgare TaxID=112509 RepID=A0A8I6X2H6_HORVV|nr:uncharacterized protein LOC123425427 [Hordeum vulgare subsp. vulgare]